MMKTIMIDGKETALLANAATPFRFRQIFKKDLLAILGNEKRAEEEGVVTVTQLAYIMAKQAEKTDLTTLNENTFIEWLEGFGPMAFVEAAEDILNVYMDSAVSSANP